MVILCVTVLQQNVESSFQELEARGRDRAISLFRGVLDAFPDGQWIVEKASMVNVERTKSDGSSEIVRAIQGNFTHLGWLLAG
jgi:hypothetical protein